MYAAPRRTAHSLRVDIGFTSERGRRPDNQDFAGARIPGFGGDGRRETVAAIADGVGGAKGGRDAAETAVRGFLDGFFGMSATLGASQAAGRALDAINAWIHGQGRVDPERDGMATTFTALILSRRAGHVAHVGDTRLYRFAEGALDRMTEDHTLGRGDMKNVLRRAVGMESAVRIDHATFPIRLHDRFLLCSDGVHGALPDIRLRQILGEQKSPQQTADDIVQTALEAGSADNATAMVIDVIDIPPAEQMEVASAVARLPIAKLPEPGTLVDDFRLDAIIAEGRYSRLYRALDLKNGADVALKFPHPRVADEETYRLAFVNEAWVAGRVRSPWIGEIIDLPPERRTRLYSALPFYDGETLEARLQREPRVDLREGALLATRIARGVAALHRASIIHRDIKPDNIILLKNGGLRLVDLGVARTPQLEDFPAPDIPGTPSYMAPELFAGAAGDEMSDLFALGVTLYRMFTRAYPYGEIEPFSRPRFGKPAPLAARRPDLPSWLDATIAKAVATDRQDRYGDVIEFAFEIENGVQHGRPVAAKRKSLYDRNPLLVWKLISASLAVVLLLALLRR